MYKFVSWPLSFPKERGEEKSDIERAVVKIVVPVKDSFFHSLAHISGFTDYKMCVSGRNLLAEKMKNNLVDSFSLPSDPLTSKQTNYQTFGFEESQDTLIKQLGTDKMSNKLLNYISLYLNIRLQIFDDKGKEIYLSPNKGQYLACLCRTYLQYYPLGKIGSDTLLQMQF